MSDGVAIVLFCLALVALVALVVGPLMYLTRKSARNVRRRGPVSSSSSMDDITRITD